MHQQHWGFSRRPFDNDASGACFFRSRSHQAALLKMKYVMENNLNAAMMVGPIGVGKSYLASLFAQEVDETIGPFVHVLFPQMSPLDLLSWITSELVGDVDSLSQPLTMNQVVSAFERELVSLNRNGRRPVIIIDDAHLIEDPAVFSTLQQLMNFTAYPNRQFTMILTGQPSLLARVQRMPALNDRIAARSVLQPLTHRETAAYIDLRLSTAGRDEPVFSDSAVQKIFESSGGIPRRINWLCEMSLLVGFADGLTMVSENEIEAVVEELSVAA
jgi:MSHA biogenesis protein MshM